MDTPGDNERSLDEKLQLYRQALQEEYELAQTADPDALEAIRTTATTKLLGAVPEAVERVIHLMSHAEKDTTQLNAAKFILANALGSGVSEGTADPLANLIKQLTATPAGPTSE